MARIGLQPRIVYTPRTISLCYSERSEESVFCLSYLNGRLLPLGMTGMTDTGSVSVLRYPNGKASTTKDTKSHEGLKFQGLFSVYLFASPLWSSFSNWSHYADTQWLDLTRKRTPSRKGDIMNKKIFVTLSLLCFLGLWMLVGCSKKEEAPAEQPAGQMSQPAATPIDPATVASVSGTVKFDGTAPKMSKIDMSQDAACKGANESESIVVSGGNLANVFVYVKDGLGDRTFDTPTQAATIDQQGCKYHPHVLGVMAGQNVDIKNDDMTTHNIHPTPANNREWNESQPPQAAPIEKNFAREEIMLPVKCNQHPWMKMYINVVKARSTRSPMPAANTKSKACPREITRWHSSRKNFPSRTSRSRSPPKTARRWTQASNSSGFDKLVGWFA